MDDGHDSGRICFKVLAVTGDGTRPSRSREVFPVQPDEPVRARLLIRHAATAAALTRLACVDYPRLPIGGLRRPAVNPGAGREPLPQALPVVPGIMNARKTYHAEVTRDGGFWSVRVPEIARTTQARTPAEIEPMARDLISVMEDVPAARSGWRSAAT